MRNKIRERIPIYSAVVNDNDETGLKLISLVDKPAIEIKGYAFAKKRYDLQPFEYDSYFHTHPNCNCSFNNGIWTTEPTPDGMYPCKVCLDMKSTYEKWFSKKGSGASSAPGSRNFSMEFSANKDSQVIAGPIMIPDTNIYRKDEDGEYYIQFSKDTIKKLTDKFFKNNNNRSINLDHSDVMVQGYIQEHWIVEDSTYDKSKYYGFNLPVGTSFVVIKVENEEFWNQEVKDLGKFGFSIEGILGKKLMKYSKIELSEDDMISYIISDFVEPTKDENEEEFISRCISKVINDGTAEDEKQGYAICKTYWDNKK